MSCMPQQGGSNWSQQSTLQVMQCTLLKRGDALLRVQPGMLLTKTSWLTWQLLWPFRGAARHITPSLHCNVHA